jgi:hypothetical protein
VQGFLVLKRLKWITIYFGFGVKAVAMFLSGRIILLVLYDHTVQWSALYAWVRFTNTFIIDASNDT